MTAEVIERKPNIFARCGRGFVNFFKGIGRFFKNLGYGIKDRISGFGKRFVDGSLGTKLSHLIFGAGNLYNGQIVKGLIFLTIQVGIIALMVLCPTVNSTPLGWKAFANLGLGGHEVDIETNTPATDDQLRLLFGVMMIAVVVIYIIVWLVNISSSYKADNDRKKGLKPSSFRQDCAELLDSKFHSLMLTPTIVAAGLFTLLPTVFMICIAFTSFNKIDMSDKMTELFYWTGTQNFSDMFSGQNALGAEISARFFPVLAWTIVWAILATLTCYFGGIILALLINKKGLKGKKIFRIFFVLTIAVPQFISLLAVKSLFNSAGPVNSILMDLHWIQEPIAFFGGTEANPGNEWLTKVMVIVVNMWLGVPYTMLMTSGILMNIPADLYEAATVDGASKNKMFWKITLPYIVFVTTPYLISSFIGNINSFNTIFLLTGGNPVVNSAEGEQYVAGGTDLLVTWLYKLTIEKAQYNTGAVIGILTFVITATITLVAYRNSKAYKEEDTFQ